MRGLISLKRYAPGALSAIVIGASFCCAQVDGAVVQPLSIDQMSVQADRIALGTVLDVRSRWNADRTLITSTVTLQPTAMLKGGARAIETIEMVGGTIDGLTLRRTDTPIFEPGDGLVLFMTSDNRIVGSYQGAFFTDGRLVAQCEPAHHTIRDGPKSLLRNLVDDVAFTLGQRPLDDTQLQMPGVALPNDGRYELSGFSWAWQGNPMEGSLRINPNGNDWGLGPNEGWRMADVVLGGIAWWFGVYANFKYNWEGPTSSTTDAALDGENAVFFCPSGTCDMDNTTLATTYLWTQGANIIEIDIIFNDQSFSFWTGFLCFLPGYYPEYCPCPEGHYHMMSVAAHELGHGLGLAHSAHPQSVMHPDLDPCQKRIDAYVSPGWLPDDDVDGVHAIYGEYQQQPFNFTGQQSGDTYGVCGGSAGDIDGDGVGDMIAGAPYLDSRGTNAGRVYVCSAGSGYVIHELNGQRTHDRFGWSVAGAGDINRDGRGDFIVGAPFADRLRGIVYVYSGLTGEIIFKFSGTEATDRFGWSVAGNVDVNADGYNDIIVGVPYGDFGGKVNCGRVEVYSGLAGDQLAVFAGENANDMFGWSVAGIGRINSDDYDDFLVGAPYNDDAGSKAGKAYIYSGRHLGLMYSITGYQKGSRFGYTVAALGQVDLTDGRGDYAVASPYYDRDALEEAGRVDIYSGKYGQRIYSKKGEVHGARLGWSVSSAGDYDGDGGNDIIIGTPKHSSIDFKRGRIYVRSGLTGNTLLQIDGENQGDQFGTSVGGLGDVDGDGIADVIVGAPYFEDHGKTYILRSTEEIREQRWYQNREENNSNTGPNGDFRSTQSTEHSRIRQLLRAWLEGGLLADLNDDGVVDDDDFTLIISGTQ